MADTKLANSIARRTLLAGVPAVAAVAIIPAAHAAAPAATDLAGWNRVKAEYYRADRWVDESCDRLAPVDKLLMRDDASAPTAELTYTAAGFKVGPVIVGERPGTMQLTRRNYRLEATPDHIKGSDEYAAYCRAVEAWEARPERVALVERVRQANADQSKALDASNAAWEAVAAFPLADAATLAEKVAILERDAGGTPELLTMIVESVSRDLAQINGRA